MSQSHRPVPDPAPGDHTAPENAQSTEQPWRRVHPISPFIRSWSALLIFVYLIMSFSVRELQSFIEAVNLSVGQSLLILLGLVIGILVGVLLLVLGGILTPETACMRSRGGSINSGSPPKPWNSTPA